jgi:PAS domain S-box-containing protein
MPNAPILVVDDDEAGRRALCEMLSAAGLACVGLGSGSEALAFLAHDESVALILLDLVMPEPDGFQTLRILRSRPALHDVPIVVMTSLEGDDEVARAFALGGDDFVRKPVRGRELVARIQGQLRLREYVEALAKRERDAKTILEITQTLASSLDMRDILFTVVRRIAELLKVERCSIVLAQDEHHVGYVVASSDDERLRDHPIDLAKYPEIREVMSSGEALVIRDVTTHRLLDVVRPSLPVPGFCSFAIIPIVFEKKPLGVLFLRAREVRSFDEHDLSIVAMVANATAIALRNARILQSLRDQTQQITVARFEAERRLRNLQRYADFFENAADGSLVVDPEGTILLGNPRAQEITGFGEDELIGTSLAELLAEAGGERLASLLSDFQKGVYPQGVDIPMKKKGAGPITLSVNTSSALQDEDAILLTFRDVTQDRATDVQLKQTKEFLERVIDSSVDAIVATNMDGSVLLFNRAAQRCYGYEAEEVVGKLNISQLYPPGVSKEIMRLILSGEYGGAGRLEDYHCDMLDRSGAHVPVALSASLIYDDCEPIAMVGLFTDLRERLRMQERLEAAQHELRAREKEAAIAELAGAAAHELNQPLTSVMGYAQLLKRRLEEDASSHAAADIILTEAERMAEIVRKIGKITKYETKTYVGAAKIIDLDKATGESGNLEDPAKRGQP